MKKTIVLPAMLALGFAVCLVAQSEADYQGWMKDVAATKGKAKKDMEAKQNADVATDAERLSGLFGKVAAFWAGRSVSDAESIAKNAEAASKDLAVAAKAGDDAKMASAMQTVNGACGMCHMAHREGSPGSFKIK
jgi:hypothetical protein